MFFDRSHAKSTKYHILSTGEHEIAYYTREGKAYKRARLKGYDSWDDTIEHEIPMQQFNELLRARELVRNKYLTGRG